MSDFIIENFNSNNSINIILELICLVLGILSVWFARKQNILVYPTGLVSTLITVYLLYLTHDIGNMLVNAYFSVMSIYGWYNWSYNKTDGESDLKVTKTTTKQKIIGLIIGIFTFVLVYIIYKVFGLHIDTITYVDLFTTAVFFTAMWYMALKKVESWILWTIGNVIIIPLFAYRDLLLLSLQYIILTFLAISAYIEWNKMLKNKN